MLPRFVIFLTITLILAYLAKNSIYRAFSNQNPLTPNTLASDFDPTAATAIFNNQEIPIPQYLSQLLDSPSTTLPILGSNTAPKRIEVDLTQQRLYAYEGDKQIYNYLISSGKWGKTPTGTFTIWTKLRSTKMSGGSKALHTYYYLPNVPYVMFFANDQVPKSKGFGLHGTYWHNNFGHPMSHGCVNMKTEEVAQLYYWTQPNLQGKRSINASDDNPGTPIVIYGTAPAS